MRLEDAAPVPRRLFGLISPRTPDLYTSRQTLPPGRIAFLRLRQGGPGREEARGGAIGALARFRLDLAQVTRVAHAERQPALQRRQRPVLSSLAGIAG
jgi:hypothetical protein